MFGVGKLFGLCGGGASFINIFQGNWKVFGGKYGKVWWDDFNLFVCKYNKLELLL